MKVFVSTSPIRYSAFRLIFIREKPMQYSEARQGRVFVVRLEDGDTLHEEIEMLARKESINAAAVIVLGGADAGSRLVVGPEEGRSVAVSPMEHVLDEVHEVTGVGTIFPDERGRPVFHAHVAGGRGTATVTGCVRRGVRVWHVMEAIVTELLETTGKRVLDSRTGFDLLQP
jgi:predicted DNA-binding protein with PD1-like motif